MLVKYCNAKCQRNHWSKHKNKCRERAASYATRLCSRTHRPRRTVPLIPANALGNHYDQGGGGWLKDQTNAMELLTLAANLGSSQAHYRLGNECYEWKEREVPL